MSKKILQDHSCEKVSSSGYVLNFLKFIDRPRETSPLEQWNNIFKEICDLRQPDSEISRYVLKCLNQFDAFRLSQTIDDVKAIDKVLNQPISPFCIADRRFLCYSLEKDNSSINPRDIFSNDNLVAVVLLKINNSINLGSFLEENIAIKILTQILNDYLHLVKCFILRTFANKEIFIVANAPNLADLDSLVRILQGVRIYPGSEDKAFSIVNRWFCCKGPIVNDKAKFVGEVKLYGICNRPQDKKFQCLSMLPPEIGKDKRASYSSEDEVMKAICYIDESGNRTYLPVNEVINKLFNMKCRDVPFCAVSCNLLLQHHTHEFSQKYDFHRYSFFSSQSEAEKHLIRFDPGLLLNELDKAADMLPPGLEFHGVEFKKIGKYIQRKLRNHFQKTEYEDVLILFRNLIKLIKIDIEDRERKFGDEELRRRILDQNSSTLYEGVQILQQVCRERERPNICSAWFDDGYFKSEISGFSKISNSSSFLISSIVNRPWTHTPLDYQGICMFGYNQEYFQQMALSVIKTDFQAVLAPKHHFGIFHEIGHILQGTIKENNTYIIQAEIETLANSLEPIIVEKGNKEISNRYFFKELFADLICYLYGINNLDLYLKNHVKYFIDTVLYGKGKYDFSDHSMESQKEIYRLFFIIIVNRLLTTDVSQYMRSLNDHSTYDVIRDAIHDVSTFLLKQDENVKNTLTIRLANISQNAFEKFSEIADQRNSSAADSVDMDRLNQNQKNFYIVFSAAKKLMELINRLGNFKAHFKSFWEQNEDHLSAILEESKICSLRINNPQQLIVKLLEKDDNCFSRNVAVIVSFANSFDRKRYVYKCLN